MKPENKTPAFSKDLQPTPDEQADQPIMRPENKKPEYSAELAPAPGTSKVKAMVKTPKSILTRIIEKNNLAAALADLAPAWNAWIRYSKKEKVAKAAPMRAHTATLQKIITLGTDVPSAEIAAHTSADAPDDALRLFSTVHEYLQTATKTTLKALKLNK